MRSTTLMGGLVDGLPAPLTTPHWSHRLQEAVAWWPERLLRTVLLEGRLGRRAGQVDALVGFGHGAASGATRRERDAFARGFGDERARSCVSAWFEGSMAPQLRRLCACVSTGPGDPGNVAPGARTTIYGDLTGSDATMLLGGVRCEVVRARACEWVEVVRGQRLAEEEKSQIGRCFEYLPAGSWMRAVGVVLTDRPSPIRLCVGGLRAAEVGGYLSSVGAPWDSGTLRECVAEVARPDCVGAGPALVHIDVGAEVGERVGLEYKLKEGRQEHGGLGACRLLEWLSGAGLCTAGQRGALVEWPAVLRISCEGGRREFGVRRVVDTVKVSVVRGEVAAKAYLMHRTRRNVGEAGRRG